MQAERRAFLAPFPNAGVAIPARPGPGSVTWRLHGERLTVLGWPRAVLLQVAHPGIAAGVANHSSFRQSVLAPYARLASTVCAMRTLTFGSDAAARSVAARINAIHDRVHGPLTRPPDAPSSTYSARDPALLAWVHVTLVDSTLRVYERLVGPIDPTDQDRYCAEAGMVAAWFGVPEARLPRSRAAIDAAMADMLGSGALCRSRESEAVVRQVLRPSLAWLGGPVAGFVRRLTISELPPEIRALHALDWKARDARALDRALRLVWAVRSRAPRAVTQWPEFRAGGSTV